MLDSLTLEQVRNLFSDHEIEYHVDTGGQKAVFKGRYQNEEVVFKILPIQSESSTVRAEREIEAMKRIDTPGLVQLVDYFPKRIDGEIALIIIEEWLEGNTVRELITMGDYGVELGLKVTRSILTTLQAFFEENIVHRDIKPSNIIMTSNNQIKLLDVGVARFLTEASLTPTYAPIGPGTPLYAAPEQLENEKDLQDSRTDLFSTGIVLYECITSEHPFDVEGMDIPRAILADEKKRLRGLGINSGAETAIHKFYDALTGHEPYQRFRKPKFALERIDEIEGVLK